jgi:hypothetical protein
MSRTSGSARQDVVVIVLHFPEIYLEGKRAEESNEVLEHAQAVHAPGSCQKADDARLSVFSKMYARPGSSRSIDQKRASSMVAWTRSGPAFHQGKHVGGST